MFTALARRVLGTPNDRVVKAYSAVTEQINALESEIEALSDDGLLDGTAKYGRAFREALLGFHLSVAFAVARGFDARAALRRARGDLDRLLELAAVECAHLVGELPAAVYAAATHPIFSGPAIKRLSKAGFKEVVVTDSIPVKKNALKGLKVLSIAPMLAEVIQHIEKGQSVTEIYLQ